jgi:hypothetical protein
MMCNAKMFLCIEEENLKQENWRGNKKANLTITQDSKHICQVIAHIPICLLLLPKSLQLSQKTNMHGCGYKSFACITNSSTRASLVG